METHLNNNILFRASMIGNLMIESRGAIITEKQKETLKNYKERVNNNGKSLTENQILEYKSLLEKENYKPTLSETAKRAIEIQWLKNEKNYYDELDNKYIEKGHLNEIDGIILVSEIEDNFYAKNTERITIGNITGEADVICVINGKKVIKDIKSSWSPITFMNSDLSTIYEWQGICYMMLYDADEFHLHYCLTDTPQHLIEKEKDKHFFKYYDKGMTDLEQENLLINLQPIFEQIEKNMCFSQGNYTKEERVKTFKIYRDKEKEKMLLEKIPLAIEYYNSIKLNQ